MRTSTTTLDRTLTALAHPVRREILDRLMGGSRSVTELAEPFDMTVPAVSMHIATLEKAGLIARGRDAQWRPCRLDAAPIACGRGLAGGLSPLLGRKPRPARGLRADSRK